MGMLWRVVHAAILAVIFVGAQRRDDPDRIYFPGSDPGRSEANRSDEDSMLATSIDFARKINNVNSTDEFLKLIIDVPETVKISLASRFADIDERANKEVAKPANCIPELQPVSFTDENDYNPSIIYYPSCTRIKRCGGCCSHSLFSCQPVATQMRNFEVIVTKYDPTRGLIYDSRQIIPLEEHTKCKCDCIVKAEDCNEKQVYVAHECRCVCKNRDEEEKCKRSHDTKLWDPSRCACICRSTNTDCSTGYYFDQSTCRCREVPISKTWLGNSRRTGYRFGQTQKPDMPVIVPLDASDPRRRHKDDPEY